jgi:hypothetical protein
MEKCEFYLRRPQNHCRNPQRKWKNWEANTMTLISLRDIVNLILSLLLVLHKLLVSRYINLWRVTCILSLNSCDKCFFTFFDSASSIRSWYLLLSNHQGAAFFFLLLLLSFLPSVLQ